MPRWTSNDFYDFVGHQFILGTGAARDESCRIEKSRYETCFPTVSAVSAISVSMIFEEDVSVRGFLCYGATG